jgi:hypothetical protein
VLNSTVSLQPCLPVYMLTVAAKLRFYELKEDRVLVPNLQVGAFSLWGYSVRPN